MAEGVSAAVYGHPPLRLASVPAAAVQLSPLSPGGEALETLPDASLDSLVVLAPPGTIERRYVLAHALRALKPAGALTALAPKAAGGSRLRGELEAFGCQVGEHPKGGHRICVTEPPKTPTGIAEAIAEGAPRVVAPLGLWSQPGVFSWNRIDPGSEALVKALPALAGRGADFGCGVGYLAHTVLASPKVTGLTLVDIDRRAVACAEHNVDDARVDFRWADVRSLELSGLDFVVMNPPFHDAGEEDRGLGQTFIRKAAAALRKGGVCWLVANRHLPYEAVLGETFARVTPKETPGGYKVFEAVK